jgi:adenylate kinase family enzyme
VSEDLAVMRIVVLGPGAAGKSTFSKSLAKATGLVWVELDKLFWNANLDPMSPNEWVEVQRDLTREESWILDGDLGPYDVVDVRLGRADIVVLFDPPTWRCVWRTLRRSRQRLDYWRWILTWRRRYLPELKKRIAERPEVRVLIIRSRHDIEGVRSALGIGPVKPDT